MARIASIPVSMQYGVPVLNARINGTDVRLIAHTGEFYSMLTPAAVRQLQLSTFPAPISLGVEFDGHRAKALQTNVGKFSFGGLTAPNVIFLVAGAVGPEFAGVLGQNVLNKNDAEFDLSKGMINLMRTSGCEDTNLAYWTQGTTQSYSVIEIAPTNIKTTTILSYAYINGQKVFVTFNTGVLRSVLSLRAAKKLGIDPKAPGVVPGGMVAGPKDRTESWIAPFASFKLGEEEIKNTHLRIADTFTGGEDMIIGNDFFLAHRIYVSGESKRLFFTYEGGPIFNLTTVAGVVPPAVNPPTTP